MQIGSVTFFKKLILRSILVVMVFLVVVLVLLLMYNARLRHDVETLGQDLQEMQSLVAQLQGQGTGTEPIPDGNLLNNPSSDEPSFAYQAMYPDLYCEPPAAFVPTEGKVAYITIDDGLSPYTTQILDALAANNTKATFFVVGRNLQGREELLRRIVDEGHALGIHSYSHELTEIYDSVDAFLADYNLVYEQIKEMTGQETTIFRFPGGSINSYNTTTYQNIIAEMTRRGFTYFDWNISAEDANTSANYDNVYSRLIGSYAQYERAHILMHEKSFTVAVLDGLIPSMRQNGYRFELLDNTVRPVMFGYSP